MSWEARLAALIVGAWHVAGGQGQAVAQQFSVDWQQAAAQSSPTLALITAADNGVIANDKAIVMSTANFIGVNLDRRTWMSNGRSPILRCWLSGVP
jgi:hypothetical protein